jgi:uncharacterized protein (TIGR00369 family)
MAKSKLSHGHAIHGKPKPRKNHCFGCGHDNPQGMRLKFSLDEDSRQAICHFKLTRRFTGPPGHAHGGIIATILDEAMGKVNKFRNVLALTGSMEIRYLRPVPLGQPLTVTAREQSVDGRRHINLAEISNEKGDWRGARPPLWQSIRKRCLPGTCHPCPLASRNPEQRRDYGGRKAANLVK